MKKILLLTNTASMVIQFNMRNIELLVKNNYEVHIGCNFEYGNTCSSDIVADFKNNLLQSNKKFYQIDFGRNFSNIFSFFKVYNQINSILKKEKFDAIFCQSTIAGVFGRLLGRKHCCKVLYMVHGFQFYKGASILRWSIFYTLEKLLSSKTDILILTNKDDYGLALSKFKAKKTLYVPGVGIEINNYKRNELEGEKIRKELGISKSDFVIFSAGELSERKNLRVVLHVIHELNMPNIKYLICGIGLLENEFRTYIQENHLENNIFLLGYRKDLCNIFSAANLFVFPSFYEGLPVSLMMALSTRTPVVCSNIRGNKDLMNDSNYMFDPHNKNMIKDKILMAMESNNATVVDTNYESVQNFSSERVDSLMNEIFKTF